MLQTRVQHSAGAGVESSNLIKVVAAFLAGIVITLGGILIYVRTNEMIHPNRVTHLSTAGENGSGTADPGSVIGQDSSDASLQTPPVASDDLPELKPVPKFQPTPRPAPEKPAAKPAAKPVAKTVSKPTVKPVRQPEVRAAKAPKPEWQIAQNLHPAKAVLASKAAVPATVAQNNKPPSQQGAVRPAPAPPPTSPQDSGQAPGESAVPEASKTDDSVPVLPERPPNAEQENPTPQEPNPTQPQPSAAPQSNPAPAPAQASPVPQSNPIPPQPHTVTLPPGTNVVVRLGETLSTEDNYTGDTFRAHLESPIIMDGFIIADKGSKVLGRIVNAQKAGRVEGVAQLTLTLTEINTTDGQRVKIETSTWNKSGVKTTGEDAAKIAGGAALGAIIGGAAAGGKGAAIGAGAGGAAGAGVVLATRGKSATLPVETRLAFRLANPVVITERLNF